MADHRNTGGGPHQHRPRPPLDGAFLLHLLQNPNPNPSPSQQQHQQSQPRKPVPRNKPSSSSPSLGLGFFTQGEGPRGDPAVAAMGPSHPFLPHSFLPPPPNLNLNHHQHPLHFSPPPPGFHPRAPPGFAEGGFLNSRTGGYRNTEAEQQMARSAPPERRHLGEVGGFMTSNGQSSLRRGNEGRAGTSGISREEVVRGKGFEVIERGDVMAERLEDALVLGDDTVEGNLVKSTSSSSRGKVMLFAHLTSPYNLAAPVCRQNWYLQVLSFGSLCSD